MTNILDDLNADKVGAMKLLNHPDESVKRVAELRLTTIRSVLSEIDSDSKSKNPRGVVVVLKAEHSKRIGSADIYHEIVVNSESSEKDRVSAAVREMREVAEAAVVAEFLPKEPNAQELEAFIINYVGGNGLEGTGRKSMGIVMKALKGEFENFDGKLASSVTMKILG